MSRDAMLACFKCGVRLENVMDDSDNQPSKGTEFRTFGHYGSTFWDSFAGEELVLNICDECLRGHTSALARHKRCISLVVDEPDGRWRVPTRVGRQWVTREMVPYFDGPEDEDQIRIEVHEIGVLDRKGEGGYDRIEWVGNWREIKASLMEQQLAVDDQPPGCKHVRFVAECLDCGATPLQGLR